ncbi:MAG: helix-turn-helix domain-containing protein [Chloracidobacterium sp.]|nr:helix-turn-helix domain-containing protein [Chloracidobacterium sp.]
MQFAFRGTATEREHLKASNDKEKEELIAKIKSLADEGKSSRDIADEVGLSHVTVTRYLKAA